MKKLIHESFRFSMIYKYANLKDTGVRGDGGQPPFDLYVRYIESSMFRYIEAQAFDAMPHTTMCLAHLQPVYFCFFLEKEVNRPMYT